MRYVGFVVAFLTFCLLSTAGSALETASGPAPNSDATYKALRTAGLGTEAVNLTNFVFKRDASTFTVTGTMCFVAPVDGKVTGAVFTGTGSFTLVPPAEFEK